MTDIPCHYQRYVPLHTTPAVVFVHIPDHPEHTYQYLCWQHLWKLDLDHEILMDRRKDYPLVRGPDAKAD